MFNIIFVRGVGVLFSTNHLSFLVWIPSTSVQNVHTYSHVLLFHLVPYDIWCIKNLARTRPMCAHTSRSIACPYVIDGCTLERCMCSDRRPAGKLRKATGGLFADVGRHVPRLYGLKSRCLLRFKQNRSSLTPKKKKFLNNIHAYRSPFVLSRSRACVPHLQLTGARCGQTELA